MSDAPRAVIIVHHTHTPSLSTINKDFSQFSFTQFSKQHFPFMRFTHWRYISFITHHCGFHQSFHNAKFFLIFRRRRASTKCSVWNVYNQSLVCPLQSSNEGWYFENCSSFGKCFRFQIYWMFAVILLLKEI